MKSVTISPAFEAVELIYGQASPLFHNLSADALVRHAVENGEGVIADNGALVCRTGKFTGRTPQDRYVVKDAQTELTVDWGEVNQPVSTEVFDRLLAKIVSFVKEKPLYVRDAYVCADPAYRMNIRVINTLAYHNLFCHNMFMRPEEEPAGFEPDFHIICVPEFEADPATDGVRNRNFVILNLTERIVLIGGTAYTGEMKKSVFSALNYLLPTQQHALPMHCSANVGEAGDTALFFGLSGTGKTTLSTDPARRLIGDDEHGWDNNGVFNFEGGCYAKVINLSAENEPDIFNAIRSGAIVENVVFHPDTHSINFVNRSLTENTRVSYPIYHIDNVQPGLRGDLPKNIFFLSADAFGVLPPIARLNTQQAMYHFLSGYTAKVAGTEAGVSEPKAVFSACFGAPFLPLHPGVYARMLGDKLRENKINVWLVNTGWIGGDYHSGNRISLPYTRALIRAALNGDLDKVAYLPHPIFGFDMPSQCTDVPTSMLNPANMWADARAYDCQARILAWKFNQNFARYASFAGEEILRGGPLVDI